MFGWVNAEGSVADTRASTVRVSCYEVDLQIVAVPYEYLKDWPFHA